MKYLIAALVAMLVLSAGALANGAGGDTSGCNGSGGSGGEGQNPQFPCVDCPPGGAWLGNVIYQDNTQTSEVSQTGTTYQKAANWAVVAGDDNLLDQNNKQDATAADSGEVNQSSTNVGLLVGYGNAAYQYNDPNVQLKQLNEIIILGNDNFADQSNNADSWAPNGTVNQDQWNFGLILGNNNSLYQTNDANATNLGTDVATINQTQANAAYLFGFENAVFQNNTNDATVLENCSGSINQTAKNLAFAISSCCTTEFVPTCENQTVNATCPGFPEAPAVPAWGGSFPFPLDP